MKDLRDLYERAFSSQVLHYDPRQEFKEHHDYFDPATDPPENFEPGDFSTLHPQFSTINLESSTPHSKPSTLNTES